MLFHVTCALLQTGGPIRAIVPAKLRTHRQHPDREPDDDVDERVGERRVADRPVRPRIDAVDPYKRPCEIEKDQIDDEWDEGLLHGKDA